MESNLEEGNTVGITFIEDKEQSCLECNRLCANKRSLANHVVRSHRELGGLRGYTLKFMLNGIVPTCRCGCGVEVTWHTTLHRFNTYITGHNVVGFAVKQPTLTKEQIEKRSVSIRRAYEERGGDIRRRIGSAVSVAMRQSGKDFSSYFRDKWRDPSFKNAQYVSRVKSWEGEAGEKRRKKIFTKEFSKKISDANMRRNINRTSLPEVLLVNRLRSIGMQVDSGRWFNFPEKTWCADIWLPEREAIVELDGLFWHGLDRGSDFSASQIVSMTNDLRKNLIARRHNLTIIRIKEGDRIEEIESYDDLVRMSYHYVDRGDVVKEGTFALADSAHIVSRDSLIRMTARDGKDEIRNTYLPIIEDFLRAYVAYWGWFYPTDSTDISRILSDVQKGSKSLNTSPAGSNWLKSRVKSYWDVDDGPAQKFMCPRTLRSVVSYRLGLNSSKLYSYTMNDGTTATCNETFNITLKDIRTGFLVQRNKVSWFKPSWAAYVYRHFCTGSTNPTVWDPSIGFSSRLLGFSSIFDEGTYIGTDPSSRMCSDARKVAVEINSIKPNLQFKVIESGSESWIPDEGSLDLVFTSPPYFDTERYFDEPGQCWRDFPDFKLWIESYLIPTLKNARFGLKIGCNLVINISEKFRNTMISACNSVGFSLIDELRMGLTPDHFDRRNQHIGRSELFLVFS